MAAVGKKPAPVGYSGKPLPEKLGLKSGVRFKLVGAPPGFGDVLAPMPDGVRRVSGGVEADCVLLFSRAAGKLAPAFRAAAAALPAAGMLWIAWPKKSSGVATDLTEDVVRGIGLKAGLVDVKVCAVTEVWSGLKFVRRLKDR